MSLFATLVLTYFIGRYATWAVKAWHDGQVIGAVLTGLLTASLFIPLVAAWS